MCLKDCRLHDFFQLVTWLFFFFSFSNVFYDQVLVDASVVLCKQVVINF